MVLTGCTPSPAGSQGRVFRGTLDGEPVAVKVVDNASTLRKLGVQIHPQPSPVPCAAHCHVLADKTLRTLMGILAAS